MKKLVALVLLVVLLTAPIAARAAESEERTFDGKVLATLDLGATADEIKYFFQEQLDIPIADFVVFPSITEAYMALKRGNVDTLLSMDASAEYLAALDPSLYTYIDPRLSGLNDISLSMVTLGSRADLGAKLDEAILHLQDTGAMNELILGIFGTSDYEPTPYEPVNGTLYVGVTGDMPPVDYINDAGEPIGFNVRLMTDIGAYLGYDIEFVRFDKNALNMALSSGQIDVVFWQEQSINDTVEDMVGGVSDELYVTKPYLTLSVIAIELK